VGTKASNKSTEEKMRWVGDIPKQISQSQHDTHDEIKLCGPGPYPSNVGEGKSDALVILDLRKRSDNWW